MRELTIQEAAEVSGGVSLSGGMDAIAGIVGAAAVLSIAPAAVAFGAGVLLVYGVAEMINS